MPLAHRTQRCRLDRNICRLRRMQEPRRPITPPHTPSGRHPIEMSRTGRDCPPSRRFVDTPKPVHWQAQDIVRSLWCVRRMWSVNTPYPCGDQATGQELLGNPTALSRAAMPHDWEREGPSGRYVVEQPSEIYQCTGTSRHYFCALAKNILSRPSSIACSSCVTNSTLRTSHSPSCLSIFAEHVLTRSHQYNARSRFP